ncbi:hypothetical protein DFH06DRAFT_1324158 [Mycena polygramma]|nr:hypothetical protein DFH06DRAFT_1324158 [Mycena polygramma]
MAISLRVSLRLSLTLSPAAFDSPRPTYLCAPAWFFARCVTVMTFGHRYHSKSSPNCQRSPATPRLQNPRRRGRQSPHWQIFMPGSMTPAPNVVGTLRRQSHRPSCRYFFVPRFLLPKLFSPDPHPASSRERCNQPPLLHAASALSPLPHRLRCPLCAHNYMPQSCYSPSRCRASRYSATRRFPFEPPLILLLCDHNSYLACCPATDTAAPLLPHACVCDALLGAGLVVARWSVECRVLAPRALPLPFVACASVCRAFASFVGAMVDRAGQRIARPLSRVRRPVRRYAAANTAMVADMQFRSWVATPTRINPLPYRLDGGYTAPAAQKPDILQDPPFNSGSSHEALWSVVTSFCTTFESRSSLSSISPGSLPPGELADSSSLAIPCRLDPN